MTSAPSAFIDPWKIGPTVVSEIGFFEDPLTVTNPVGPEADSVSVKLFDYDCVSETIFSSVSLSDISLSDGTATYDVIFDTESFGSDSAVTFTGDAKSTGNVKFCTRVTATEGTDLDVTFRETNFELEFSMTDNEFAVGPITIEENDKDEFETDVEDEFILEACQCVDQTCVDPLLPSVVLQNTPLVFCVYVTHGDTGVADTVDISNIDVTIEAGEISYQPVTMGSETWDPNALTVVNSFGSKVEVISNLITDFFTEGFTSVDVSGNAFLVFVEGSARLDMEGFGMVVDIEGKPEIGCVEKLLKKFF
jgi:hypothetical protein